MNKAIFLFLLSIVLLPLHIFASESFGDWGPIRDVKDPHVIKIGQFAVFEYNKQSKYVLKFMNIVRVFGINYRLVVEANYDSNNVGTMYEAVVLDQPWMKKMNLIFLHTIIRETLPMMSLHVLNFAIIKTK
ncbi:hypothetical protein N665_0831s0016 [Sinapis alba]|nr:hypothetical protein N665_0831s0016 [Sinapis alba]